MRRAFGAIAVIGVTIFCTSCKGPNVAPRHGGVPEFFDYSMTGAAEPNGRKDLLDRESRPRRNEYRLRYGQQQPRNPNTSVLLSFIHVSDAQIRDHGIVLQNNIVEGLIDKVAKGTVRPQALDENDEYPLLALVEAINNACCRRGTGEGALRPEEAPRFVIHTGDTIDAGTEGEFVQFINVANRLMIPWYDLVGNHDIFYFGNFTQRDLRTSSLLSGLDLVKSRARFIEAHGQAARTHFPGGMSDFYFTHGPTEEGYGLLPRSLYHGFDLTPCGPDESQRTGHYSFALEAAQPGIRIIVLDTVAQDPDVELGNSGLQIPGTGAYPRVLDEDQFRWLKIEIERAAASNQYVLLFGHHPLVSEDGEGDLQFRTDVGSGRGRLLDYLIKQNRVLAYFGGHTHYPRLRPYDRADGTQFVEVIAASIHEYPQEAYLVEVLKEAKAGDSYDLRLSVNTVVGDAPADTSVGVRLGKAREAALADATPRQKQSSLDQLEKEASFLGARGATAAGGQSLECERHNGITIPQLVDQIFFLADPQTRRGRKEVMDSIAGRVSSVPAPATGNPSSTKELRVKRHDGVYFQGSHDFLKLQTYDLPEGARFVRPYSLGDQTTAHLEQPSWVFLEDAAGKIQQLQPVARDDGFKHWPLCKNAASSAACDWGGPARLYVVAVYRNGKTCQDGVVDIWVEVDDLAGEIAEMNVVYGGRVANPVLARGFEFPRYQPYLFYPMPQSALTPIEAPANAAVEWFGKLMTTFNDPSQVTSAVDEDQDWGLALQLWSELRDAAKNHWAGVRVAHESSDLVLLGTGKFAGASPTS